MSDVSDEDAMRMQVTFRQSRHVKMVWRVADISGQVMRVGLVEFGERHTRHPRNKLRVYRAWLVGEDVSRMLLG